MYGDLWIFRDVSLLSSTTKRLIHKSAFVPDLAPVKCLQAPIIESW